MDETAPTPTPVPPKFRFSMATAMLLVIPAAAASALFAKIYQVVPVNVVPFHRVDMPLLFVGSIILTAIALGAMKGHSANQMMLQATLACLGYLSLIELLEVGQQRPLLYWFQASFAVLVTLPMIGRRVARLRIERGPRRTRWKKTFEAIVFSFLTMLLVLAGLGLQFLSAFIGQAGIKF